MNEHYFYGVFAAYLGSNFINAPIAEWQIEAAKASLSLFEETRIEHSLLSPQDKAEWKLQMRENLEAYICGVKSYMIENGKLIRE